VSKLHLGFDLGVALPFAMQATTVCITHTHTDHIAALPAHARYHQLSGATVRYIVPPGSAARLRQLIDGFAALDEGADQLGPGMANGCSRVEVDDVDADENDDARSYTGSDGDGDSAGKADTPTLSGTRDLGAAHPAPASQHVIFIDAEPGRLIHLSGPFYVTAFATQHRVPSQGYCLLRQHTLTSGEASLSPEVCFTGDCTWESLAQVPFVWASKVLISEMTFMDATPQRMQSCRRTMHVHLLDVVGTLPRFRQDARLIFSHFSTRYSARMVMRHVGAEVGAADCDRISLALQSHDEPRPDVAWALYRAWSILWPKSRRHGERSQNRGGGRGRGRGSDGAGSDGRGQNGGHARGHGRGQGHGRGHVTPAAGQCGLAALRVKKKKHMMHNAAHHASIMRLSCSLLQSGPALIFSRLCPCLEAAATQAGALTLAAVCHGASLETVHLLARVRHVAPLAPLLWITLAKTEVSRSSLSSPLARS
jgi:ribonuclease BN (tRNA processing enzyme)